MDLLHDDLNTLRVREVQPSTTWCLLDCDARLLSISGWPQCLTKDAVIALTIVDETDELEWTCMIECYAPYRREDDESFQVKIPSSSIDHSFVVTTKILRPISHGSVDCYEVTSESSCTAKTSSTRFTGIASLPVLDARPRLRSNVGIRNGKEMLSILTAGSLLPIEKSKSLTCAGGDSVELQIYQGNSKRISRNNRIQSIMVDFESKELENGVKLTLDVTKDGKLTAIASERGCNENTKYSKARGGIDVICPQIAIDTMDPKLRVEWTEQAGVDKKGILVINKKYDDFNRWFESIAEAEVASGNGGRVFLFPRDEYTERFEIPSNILGDTGPEVHVEWSRTVIIRKAFLDISTTYAEIHGWRVSVAAALVTTGSGGLVFTFPRDGNSQRFNIPSNILEAGVSYEVKVEGLEEIDDQDVDRDVYSFRIVCRNSTTLKPTALSVSRVDLDLRIEIERSTFNQASVIISINPQAARPNRKWIIRVDKSAKTTGSVSYYQVRQYYTLATVSRQRFDIPLQFEAGSSYRVAVAPLEWSDGSYHNPDNSVEQTAEFRAELTLEDIKALYRMAVPHAAGYSSPCHWLYRNQSAEYFEKIRLSRGGIMEVYEKGNGGDPASPINLQIKALSFMASVERGTGEPMSRSPFGPLRICIPAEDLLAKAPNVFFVDFYCMMRGLNHQVTLVMTKPGTETDQFCAERLLPLDLNNNPFFFRDATGQLRVSTKYQLLVEVLFTEDLDISRYALEQVPTVGKGSSAPGGIPKNAHCLLCNLQPYTAFAKSRMFCI